MLACKVYLNGLQVDEHLGGYAPFSVDITHAVKEGANVLTVVVDSNERTDIPPYGHQVDYLTFGGIYRDVHLFAWNQLILKISSSRQPMSLKIPT